MLYSGLKYPLVKISVSGAISSIESKFIYNSIENEADIESFNFFKNQILGVSNGYKRSTETRQVVVVILGVGNIVIGLFLFFYMPLLTNRSN